MRRAALTFGALLRELGLDAVGDDDRARAATTWSSRCSAGPTSTRCATFARDLAELAAAREPRTFTNEQRKAKREGKILIDIQRNAYAHTAVAPYSVRPRSGAPVATPLHWEELEDSTTTRRIAGRSRRCPSGWSVTGTRGSRSATPPRR